MCAALHECASCPCRERLGWAGHGRWVRSSNAPHPKLLALLLLVLSLQQGEAQPHGGVDTGAGGAARTQLHTGAGAAAGKRRLRLRKPALPAGASRLLAARASPRLCALVHAAHCTPARVCLSSLVPLAGVGGRAQKAAKRVGAAVPRAWVRGHCGQQHLARWHAHPQPPGEPLCCAGCFELLGTGSCGGMQLACPEWTATPACCRHAAAVLPCCRPAPAMLTCTCRRLPDWDETT